MTKTNGRLARMLTALLLVAMLASGEGARAPRPTREVDDVCVMEVL